MMIREKEWDNNDNNNNNKFLLTDCIENDEVCVCVWDDGANNWWDEEESSFNSSSSSSSRSKKKLKTTERWECAQYWLLWYVRYKRGSHSASVERRQSIQEHQLHVVVTYVRHQVANLWSSLFWPFYRPSVRLPIKASNTTTNRQLITW